MTLDRTLVAEAKTIQLQADSLLATHSGFTPDGTVTDNKAAAEFLRQTDNLQRDAIRKMKSASKELLDFVRDYRKLFGNVRVNEKGELEAGGTNATPATTSTVNATATVTVTATATPTDTATPAATATATEIATATPTATTEGNSS